MTNPAWRCVICFDKLWQILLWTRCPIFDTIMANLAFVADDCDAGDDAAADGDDDAGDDPGDEAAWAIV